METRLGGGECPRLRWSFYSNGEWESDGPEEGSMRQWCRFNASISA
jgi:hypothetical protein